MASEWHRLAGNLNVKIQGGAFAMLMRPRKRFYVILDENSRSLIYFKSESDYLEKRGSMGRIELEGAMIANNPDNSSLFTINCMTKQQFEIEADNESSSNVWKHSISKLISPSNGKSGLGLSNYGDMICPEYDRKVSGETVLPSDLEMEELLDAAFKTSLKGGTSQFCSISNAAPPGTNLPKVPNALMNTPMFSKSYSIFNFPDKSDAPKPSESHLLHDANAEKVKLLEDKIEEYKRSYVFLLQSCIRIPLHEKRNLVEIKLYGGNEHRIRISTLIDEAKLSDPTLPTFDSLCRGGTHMDVYGFQHSFSDEGLLLHYLCTQLHNHYQRHQQVLNKERWKIYLKTKNGIIVNCKESRSLVRAGIPAGYRSTIWRRLIHHHVSDIKQRLGKYYYKNLLSSCHVQDNVANNHQIMLDLLRTMPNNIHFSTPSCKGISQLQEVLTAFCQHNTVIGYCQGMNFIAATALLFLNPEDAFWLLIAITEKYFISSYFDASLSGAQADQEVLKDLVAEKLPELTAHLQHSDIDLATITFNWFLALFFDSIPFEVLLRIWDCFLLEGPKVLFRFSLALLHMHKDSLMERSDTISIMRILKAATKYTYDADGLVKVAFETLKPFPHRKDLSRKQAAYLLLLRKRIKMKADWGVPQPEKFSVNLLPSKATMQITLCFEYNEGKVLLVYGHQSISNLAIVDVHGGTMSDMGIQFDCRATSGVVHNEIVLIAFISACITAVNISRREIIWEVHIRDVATTLVCANNALFAGLSNGSLAVIELTGNTPPSLNETYYIPLGPAPVSAMCIVKEQLWCAIAGKAIVLNMKTLDCVEEVHLAGNAAGGSVSFFERVYALINTPLFGVWLVLRNSSLVQLWDPVRLTAILLHDVKHDHFNVTYREDDPIQITSLLCVDSCVWVGTADGYLMIYEIKRRSNVSHTMGTSNLLTPCNPGSKRLSFQQRNFPSNSFETNVTSFSPSSNASISNLSSSASNSTSDSAKSGNPLNESGYGSKILVDERKTTRIQRSATTENASREFKESNLENSNFSLEPGNKDSRAVKSLVHSSSVDSADSSMTQTAKPQSLSQLITKYASPQMRSMNNSKDGCDDFRTFYKPAANTSQRNTSNETDYDKQNCRKYSAMNEEPKNLILGDDESVSWRRRSSTELSNYASMTSSQTSAARSSRDSFGALRSIASASSLMTAATYEFDDYLPNPYTDSDYALSPRSSPMEERMDTDWKATFGLATSSLVRSESAWSIQSTDPITNQRSLNYVSKVEKWDIEKEMDLYLDDVKLKRKDMDIELFIRPKQQIKGGPGSFCRSGSPGTQSDYLSEYESDCERISYFGGSDAASVISVGSVVEAPFLYELALQMMLKISDSPVTNLVLCRLAKEEQSIISTSGSFKDEEAVLKWVRVPEQKLWTNDPIVNMNALRQKKDLMNKGMNTNKPLVARKSN